MKKRILASCISIAIATSMITGCNIADKINDIKEVTNSENAQVDRNNNENEQAAKDEKTVLDLAQTGRTMMWNQEKNWILGM